VGTLLVCRVARQGAPNARSSIGHGIKRRPAPAERLTLVHRRDGGHSSQPFGGPSSDTGEVKPRAATAEPVVDDAMAKHVGMDVKSQCLAPTMQHSEQSTGSKTTLSTGPDPVVLTFTDS
jgi:hypothetical protein